MKKLFVFAASLFALCAATSCAESAPATPKKDIGVELYSIRDVVGNPELWAANHEAALKELADEGYTCVEAACFQGDVMTFYGVAPEEFKAQVEAAGMRVLSSHTGYGISNEQMENGDFEAALEWWKKAIPAHVAAGCEYVVMPGHPFPANVKQMDTFCQYLDAVGKLCKEAGLKFGYHNHSHEFNQVEGEVFYDYVLAHTNPEYVFFQMDVYWAVMGHVSPVNYFTKYPGRFLCLHIKDWEVIGASGMVGFDAIFKNAEVAGLKNIVVEVERFSGAWQDTMKASADYLNNNDFVQF